MDVPMPPGKEWMQTYLRLAEEDPVLEFLEDAAVDSKGWRQPIEKYEIGSDRIILKSPKGESPTVFLLDENRARLEVSQAGKTVSMVLRRIVPGESELATRQKRLAGHPLLGTWLRDERVRMVFHDTGAMTESDDRAALVGAWDIVEGNQLVVVSAGMPARVDYEIKGDSVTLRYLNTKSTMKRLDEPAYPRAKATPVGYQLTPDVALAKYPEVCAARQACVETCQTASRPEPGLKDAKKLEQQTADHCRRTCGDPKAEACRPRKPKPRR